MFSLRADFKKLAVVRPEQFQWVQSPMRGVERMMLDRIGDEVARATSLVRYAPNSEFSPHRHDGGEEFFVLEGVFSDEHGDYPAGSYVRNPIGTSHRPRVGPDGAVIFVKLHQFDRHDQTPVSIFTPDKEWLPDVVDGLRVMPLHDFGDEHIALVHWAPDREFSPRELAGGEEILVLEGDFSDEFGHYPTGSWIRYPHGFRHAPRSGSAGTLMLSKAGHLLHPQSVSMAG